MSCLSYIEKLGINVFIELDDIDNNKLKHEDLLYNLFEILLFKYEELYTGLNNLCKCNDEIYIKFYEKLVNYLRINNIFYDVKKLYDFEPSVKINIVLSYVYFKFYKSAYVKKNWKMITVNHFYFWQDYIFWNSL